MQFANIVEYHYVLFLFQETGYNTITALLISPHVWWTYWPHHIPVLLAFLLFFFQVYWFVLLLRAASRACFHGLYAAKQTYDT